MPTIKACDEALRDANCRSRRDFSVYLLAIGDDASAAAGIMLQPDGQASLYRAGAGLRKYSAIPENPPDPYDIAAALAQKLMPYDEQAHTAEEQPAYQFAMEHSEEKGPCCCQCWRWKMYCGLAKYLIREHQFTGPQLIEIWNLSDGCGGSDEQEHG